MVPSFLFGEFLSTSTKWHRNDRKPAQNHCLANAWAVLKGKYGACSMLRQCHPGPSSFSPATLGQLCPWSSGLERNLREGRGGWTPCTSNILKFHPHSNTFLVISEGVCLTPHWTEAPMKWSIRLLPRYCWLHREHPGGSTLHKHSQWTISGCCIHDLCCISLILKYFSRNSTFHGQRTWQHNMHQWDLPGFQLGMPSLAHRNSRPLTPFRPTFELRWLKKTDPRVERFKWWRVGILKHFGKN